MKRIVLIGHRGALGSAVERTFMAHGGWNGFGIGRSVPSSSSSAFLRAPTAPGFSPLTSLGDVPGGVDVDAVVCVAGAFEVNNQNNIGEPGERQLARLWAANVRL